MTRPEGQFVVTLPPDDCALVLPDEHKKIINVIASKMKRKTDVTVCFTTPFLNLDS